MKIIDLQQGSTEWLEFRSNRITATDSSSIMGRDPWCSPMECWKKKLGVYPCIVESWKMKRGSEMEPLARQSFIKETGIYVEPMVVTSDKYDWMMASMDGLSEDGKIAVEIKCGAKSYKQAKLGMIPDYYECQMQHQMYVCELDMIYYYCFNGKQGITIEYKRDEEFIQNMIKYEKRFYHCMIELIEPEYPEGMLGEELVWT